MDTEEDLQCLAPAVARGDTRKHEVLFLVAETAFHHSGTQVADNASRGAHPRVFVLRLGPLAHKIGDDFVLCAVSAVGVVGIDGVGSHTLNLGARQALLVLNAFLQTDTLVECLEREVLDEGDAVYLDIVGFGSELDTLVLLAADDRADIRAVDAHDAVLHFPLVEQLTLLPQHFPAGQQPFVPLFVEDDVYGAHFYQTVPLAKQF